MRDLKRQSHLTVSATGTSWVLLVANLTLIIAMGIVGTLMFREEANVREREHLLSLARTAETAIDARSLAALSGSAADSEKPEYVKLKDTLTKIREANPDVRFAYLFAKRTPADDKLYFVADSEPVESEDYSAPGDIYDDTNQGELDAYRNGADLVEGPSRDDWGEWVSALTPVFNPDNGEVVALLGLDISTRLFNQRVRDSETLPIALTVALCALVIAYWFYLRYLQRKESELSRERAIARVTLEDLPVGVIVVEYPSGSVIMQNPQAWSLAEGEGDQTHVADYKFVNSDGSPYPADQVPLAITLKTGEKIARDDLFVARPGGNFPLRASSAPVRDSDGTIRFAVMVLEARS